jgi:phage-related protein
VGREVAEAFIEVHGDLSPFRRDLEKANADMAKLARQSADNFTEAWGKRMAEGVDKRWNSIVDQMESNQPIDINRLVKDFDATSLDEAQEKINSFILSMSRHQKLTGENYKEVKKQLNDAINATRARQKAEEALFRDEQAWTRAHLDMMDALAEKRAEVAKERKSDEKAWERANADMIAQFKEIRRAYSESFDGMFKDTQSKALLADMRGMVEAMNSADWSKFAKGFDSFDGMRDRINEVSKAMFEQGKMSDENVTRVTRDADTWIRLEKEKQDAILETARQQKLSSDEQSRLNAEALDAARRAREEAEAFDRTLEGIVQRGMVNKIEKDFRALGDAIARNDWSGIARGHDDLNSMRADVERLINTMHELDRIGDDTFDLVNQALADMDHNAESYNVRFKQANAAAEEHEGLLDRNNFAMRALGNAADNLRLKLMAMGGFNVVLDTLRDGSEFMSNLDRHAVSFAKTMTVSAGAASTLISSLGGAVTIISDLGAVAGGLLAFAPAFISGLGIGVGVLVASLKDMKKVLKDLGPGFTKLQDSISASFWKQAAQPIRDLTNNLMPLLNEKLTVTAENLGGMFTEFAKTLDNQETRDSAGRMFDRMNSAIKITQGMVAPLTNAFVTLADFGSLYFERFGTWLVDISNQFNDFIQDAAGDGRLQKWMDDTIQGLKDIWSIGGSVTGIFRAINDAATMAGSKGLHGFAENMAEIERVVSSQRFVAAMTQVFAGALDALDGLKNGFLKLGPAIESFLPTYSSIMDKFGRIFEKAFGLIADFISNPALQKGLDDFVGGIEKAFGNLKSAADPTATSLGGLFSLMGKVLDVGSRLLNEVLVKLGPKFDEIVKAIEPLIKPIGEAGSSVIDTLSAVLDTVGKDVLPPVVKLFEELLPVLTDTLKQITPESLQRFKLLGDALNGLADAADKVKEALGPLRAGGDLEWLGDFLFSGGGPGGNIGGNGNPIEEGIKNLFNGIDWEGFGKTLADGWNRLWSGNIFGDQPGKFFTEADANMNQWWDDTIGSWWDDTIGPWFDGIRGMFEDAWNGFTEFLDGLFGGGRNDGSHSGGGGGHGARSIGSVIGLEDLEDPSAWETFGSTIRENVTTFFTGVGEWITEQSATLKEGWDTFWGGFGTKVEEVWNGFWEFIITKYTEISTGLTEWWTGLQTGWNEFWDGVGRKVQEIWDGIVVWVTTKYTEIKTGIDTWITDVRTNWDNFWKGVNDKVVEIWNSVTTFIDTKRKEIQTNIDNFITTVRTNWDNFWSGIQRTVTDTWAYVVNWIGNKILEIRTNIGNFISTAAQIWDTGWRTMGKLVELGWILISNTVKTGVDNVVNWVKGLPDQIRGFFNVDLSGAGAAIMNSFRRGLESSWGAVTDFVGGIAGWIAANKGPIEYDRTLLVPAGKAIMQGLVGGLMEGMSPLENTVNLVTDTILDKVTEGLAKSKMYIAGADAALGLANGLAANGNLVADAFGNLIPDVSDLRVKAYTVGVGSPTPGTESRGVTIESGAIQVVTPTTNPELVASKVMDEIVETASVF